MTKRDLLNRMMYGEANERRIHPEFARLHASVKMLRFGDDEEREVIARHIDEKWKEILEKEGKPKRKIKPRIIPWRTDL